jgi:hypothetical protein
MHFGTSQMIICLLQNHHNPHKSKLNLLLEWIEPLARITPPKMSVYHKNPARKTKFATRIQGKKKKTNKYDRENK